MKFLTFLFLRGQDKPLLELDVVVEIAKKHNVTPAQVLIRHCLQRKIVVLAKSVTPDRIYKNIDVNFVDYPFLYFIMFKFKIISFHLRFWVSNYQMRKWINLTNRA